LLTLTNNIGETDTDTVIIVISSVPTAEAGHSQTVTEGDLVLLNGSLSSDPCDIISKYQWTQISGIDVCLNKSFDMDSSFIAPAVDAANTLGFQLIVTNSLGESEIDTVNINVNNNGTNLLPVADANIDQSVIENDTVTLDASKSFDPDGSIMHYVWKQTDKNEESVLLSENLAMTSTFKTPDVDKTTLLTFTLTVQDNDGSIDTDDVNILIEDVPDSNGGESCFISATEEQ
jgi:K319-like protein